MLLSKYVGKIEARGVTHRSIYLSPILLGCKYLPPSYAYARTCHYMRFHLSMAIIPWSVLLC